MAAILEFISHYKNEDILIWRENGKRYFSYGNKKYNSISEARSVINSIPINDDIIGNDIPDWEDADNYI